MLKKRAPSDADGLLAMLITSDGVSFSDTGPGEASSGGSYNSFLGTNKSIIEGITKWDETSKLPPGPRKICFVDCAISMVAMKAAS
jgi:hypothetical protein